VAGVIPAPGGAIASVGISFPITRIDQLAMVVHDVEAVVRAYWEQFNIGPWRIYTFGPPLVKEMTYRGRAQAYRMRLALAMCDNVQLEVIQSLEGPNIYEEFLAEHGEGVHHVAMVVPELAAAAAHLETRGYQMIQSGRGYGKFGDGAFAYFETAGPLGTTLELIERPIERVAPEAVYPPGALVE
jgi:4-hydroxyphenylpyruvate dioxygenase-like putative hemolysin